MIGSERLMFRCICRRWLSLLLAGPALGRGPDPGGRDVQCHRRHARQCRRRSSRHQDHRRAPAATASCISRPQPMSRPSHRRAPCSSTTSTKSSSPGWSRCSSRPLQGREGRGHPRRADADRRGGASGFRPAAARGDRPARLARSAQWRHLRAQHRRGAGAARSRQRRRLPGARGGLHEGDPGGR